jgi:hypothetical protein
MNRPGGHDPHVRDDEHPGYELSDVNTNGIVVFLAGLFGSVCVFFVLCYGLGILINGGIKRQDGPATKWNQVTGADTSGKRQDLVSNAKMEQNELQQVTSAFPDPRLDIDDGNQATADLHAREDLLLNYYSSSPALPGSIRIPISRAMELIAQRGLPVNAAASTAVAMTGDEKPVIQAPLTTGFARTGYELETIEARQQQLNFGKAQAENQAEVTPPK